MQTHLRTLANIFSGAPIIGSVIAGGLNGFGTVLGAAGRGIGRVIDRIAPIAFKLINGFNIGYAVATGIFHGATIFLSMNTLADIITANDPDAALSAAGILSAIVHVGTFQTTFLKTFLKNSPAHPLTAFPLGCNHFLRKI